MDDIQTYTISQYPPDEIRAQVVSQCKAVEHLAHVIARLHSDKATMFAFGEMSGILNLVGQETAGLMNVLGDILSNMDAVTEEDARFDHTFEEARRLWPESGQ